MSKIVKVLTFENEIEANIIEKILQEKKIPFNIRSYADSAYNGIFQFQYGWGCLEAPVDYYDEIVKIYNDIQKDSEEK